jgi:hypothetical protein
MGDAGPVGGSTGCPSPARATLVGPEFHRGGGGQASAVVTARQSRENCQRQLAGALGRPEGEAFTEILPLLPTDWWPLVSALVEEISNH